LREIGLNCYIDLMRRDFDKQIKYAVDKDIRFLLIVGKKNYWRIMFYYKIGIQRKNQNFNQQFRRYLQNSKK